MFLGTRYDKGVLEDQYSEQLDLLSSLAVRSRALGVEGLVLGIGHPLHCTTCRGNKRDRVVSQFEFLPQYKETLSAIPSAVGGMKSHLGWLLRINSAGPTLIQISTNLDRFDISSLSPRRGAGRMGGTGAIGNSAPRFRIAYSTMNSVVPK
jgi:hypothetical protein